MNPKHTNPKREDRTAYAPYNFIPLPEAVVPAESPSPSHDTYYSDRFTGYIECTLETKSPVYTRAALDPDFFRRWADDIQRMMQNPEARETYAQIFHLDDAQRPVIPGSSLRGMIRSLVEIVGYGRVKWVTDRRLFFRTVDNTAVGQHYRSRMMNKVEGGILRFDPRAYRYYIEKWPIVRISRTLLPKNLYGGKPPNLIPRWEYQYKRIWVKLSSNNKYVQQYSFVPTEGYRQGILVITGNVPKKRKEFVFLEPQEEPEKIALDETLIWRFHDDDQITRWQRKAFPKHRPRENSRDRDGMLRKDRYLAREGDPVFFLREDGKVTFFGRAHFFRLPYISSPSDLIPKALKEGSRDLAEAIFGFVEGDKKGFAGRVFITDAVAEAGQDNVWLFDSLTTPHILSSPKPTSFQHYLVQDKQLGHDPDIKDTLAHYDTPSGETTIRGYKFYWHKGEAPTFVEKQAVDWQGDTQHTQIKPVRPGVRFRFRVYFENLSQVELGVLLWVLDLPAGHYHKIGMGKPLGLGSVEIRPRLILTDRQARYQRLFTERGWATAEHEEHDLAQFKEAFEHYVLQHMDKGERGTAQRLTDVERIQMLLTMLKWPGPDPELKLTRYMDMKRGDFKGRPVLPDPLAVVEKSSQPTAPQRQGGSQQKPHSDDLTGKVISARIVGQWKKGKVRVSLPGGQQGKLKISKKKLQSLQVTEVKVKVVGRQGSYYKVELAG